MSTKDKTFKEKMDQLEELVEWFNSDDIELDVAVEKFEQGTKIAKELKAELDKIENKVKKLQADSN